MARALTPTPQPGKPVTIVSRARRHASVAQSVERLVKRWGLRRVVVIGVGDGTVVRHLMATCARAELLLVEDWQDPQPCPLAKRLGPDDDGSRARDRRELALAKDVLARFAGRERCQHLELGVKEAAGHVLDGSVDVLVIGSDCRPTTWAAVLRHWRPKLAAGEPWIVGTDWRVPALRSWIGQHLPEWTRMDNGALCAKANQGRAAAKTAA